MGRGAFLTTPPRPVFSRSPALSSSPVTQREMADSQLQCVEDEHVNEKISESNPEFYYSEEQRSAVDQLLQNGDGAFRLATKTGKIREFLSAKERKKLRKSWKRRDAQDEEARVERGTAAGTDTEVQSTYWPQQSDTEVPPLDIGWPDAGGYKGVTRVTIHTHPPKDNGPHIREVARRMIQEAKKVVAVVMDQISDLLLFQDLLEAAYKRKVSVYLVLDSGGLPLFIEMCRRLEITEPQIRNMRVRSVAGTGLSLAMGKLPGTLSSKYMLVDGEKVLSGSYSFTWTASRLDRNLISVMTGHIVDIFDRDFRELYAVSDAVSLHRELGLPLPPNPTKPPPTIQTKPTVTSRFETNNGAPTSNLRPPAHKYHNPKYSLVFGDALGLSSSKQDLTSASPGIMRRFLLSDAASSVVVANGDKQEAPAAPLPVTQNPEGTGGSGPKANGGLSKKLRSTFRGKNAKPNSPTSPQLQPPLGPDRLNRSDQSFEFVEKESLEDGLGKLMRNDKQKSKLSKLSFSLPTVQTLEGDGSSSPTLSNGKDSRRMSKKGCITS